MHIAVFSQYHTNPDCPATSRHYSLLTHIARQHRVTLISTDTWAPQRLTQQFPWLPAGVEMRAARVPYHNRMGVARRGWSFGQYAAYALWEGLRIDRPDVIWGISTPLTAAWAAAQVARLRRVPWVFEVQDLWPAFPIAMGAVPNGLAQRQLYALERSLYRSARHIVPLSPDMTAYVQQQGVPESKVTTVLNGTDLDLAARATDEQVQALRQREGLQDRRVVLYAGTFGRANSIPTLVEAAKQLAETHPDVVWCFLGHGYHDQLLQQAAAQHSFIRLIEPQPRHAVFAWFRLAEVSVAPFLGLPVLDANSPAKFYDSLAVGTPVVVTNGGWTKHFVEQHRCGWFAPPEDAPALARTLGAALNDAAELAAAGQRGRQVAREQFDRQQLAAAVQQILERAAS
ncbi:glycosyltransferase family 4 protein [Hymenobacter sp. B81]|uniref:glycosyltransferase family 4 protein n=1 Tax=Hymenobacter sp. B81 TaxID=3344878 RepID=UPI0037DC0683